MRSINKVIIIGNLTRDPEMRQTPSGQSVTTFGVATNRTWITKNNEKKSEAEYHEVVAWGNLAEICYKYLKKSKLVYVEGYLKTRSWDTPEGIRRFKTEIVTQDMIMLDKKSDNYDDYEYVPQDDYSSSDNFEDESSNSTETSSHQGNSQVSVSSESTESQTAPQAEAPAPTAQEEKKETGSTDIGIDDDLGL